MFYSTTNPSVPEMPPGITEWGEELALTGSQTWLLVGIALVLICMGAALVVSAGRR